MSHKPSTLLGIQDTQERSPAFLPQSMLVLGADSVTCCYELSALAGTMGRRVSAQFTGSPLLCNTEGLFLLLHGQTDTSDGGEMGNFSNFPE